MNRLEALVGVVGVAILFLPVLIVMFSADRMGKQREVARQRRIAEYRRSPEANLLILN